MERFGGSEEGRDDDDDDYDDKCRRPPPSQSPPRRYYLGRHLDEFLFGINRVSSLIYDRSRRVNKVPSRPWFFQSDTSFPSDSSSISSHYFTKHDLPHSIHIDDFMIGRVSPRSKISIRRIRRYSIYARTVLRAPRARNRTYYLFTRSLSRKSSWDGRLKLGAEKRELRSYGR